MTVIGAWAVQPILVKYRFVGDLVIFDLEASMVEGEFLKSAQRLVLAGIVGPVHENDIGRKIG